MGNGSTSSREVRSSCWLSVGSMENWLLCDDDEPAAKDKWDCWNELGWGNQRQDPLHLNTVLFLPYEICRQAKSDHGATACERAAWAVRAVTRYACMAPGGLVKGGNKGDPIVTIRVSTTPPLGGT